MNRWDRKWQALAAGARAWDAQGPSLAWEEVKVAVLRARGSKDFPPARQRELRGPEQDWLQSCGWGLKWATGMSGLLALVLLTGVMPPVSFWGELDEEVWFSNQAQAPFQSLVIAFQ